MRTRTKDGYVIAGGRREHIVLVEKALGRRLRGAEQVHHVNGVKADNRPSNLVLCPDGSYHQLLEMRTAALHACGNANWRKCEKCKTWDAPENLRIYVRNHKRRSGTVNESRFLHRRKHDWCLDANSQRIAEVVPQAKYTEERKALYRERRRQYREALAG